jgi:hypothetical protein
VTELVVPTGHIIDLVSIERLRLQLDEANDGVSAIIAPVTPLVSGASSRTAAERASLLPRRAALEPAGTARGAALVRNGLLYDVDGETVRVNRGAVVVDPGAVTHDAQRPVTELEDADPAGRSPFPRRPMVLLLGLDVDAGRSVWARDMVHALLDSQVEARIAVPVPPAGPHLTRPSRPSQATVVALRPDVVVTLDEAALDVASSWCDRRSTIVVHHTGERTTTHELLSWRIGASYGRVRALIGSAIEPTTLATLCSRLCSTPFPEPPRPEVDEPSVSVSLATRLRRDAGTRRVTLVCTDAAPEPRLDMFVAESNALGASARKLLASEWRQAVDDDVVIVAGDVDESATHDLITARRAVGRRTLVDVTHGPVPATAMASGCATAPSSAIAAKLKAADVTVRLLPPLASRSHLDELRRARSASDELEQLVIGVDVDTADPASTRALATALERVLDDRADLEVDLVGSPELRAHLARRPGIRTVDGRAPTTLARWTVQVWVGDRSAHRPSALVDAAYLAVPTVFPVPCRGDIDDPLICSLALSAPADPNGWYDALEIGLARDRTDHRLAQRAELLFGPRAGASLVNRLLGWAGRRTSA